MHENRHVSYTVLIIAGDLLLHSVKMIRQSQLNVTELRCHINDLP